MSATDETYRPNLPGMGASPDAVVSLAAYVSREWGDYGYRMNVLGLADGSAIAECRHSDGSRWWSACDRYGAQFVDADTFTECRDKLQRAVAP